MLLTFDEVTKKIADGTLLHIAGTEALLRRLPNGNWIGGSTEYFMTQDGGKVSGELLYVTEFPYNDFLIQSLSVNEIDRVAANAFDQGFSIVIVPFDSAVHKEYAEKAAEFPDMFLKNVVGWVAGLNLGVAGQTPVAVNGATGMVFADQAVVLHLKVPEGKVVNVNMINIFEQDESAPVFEFTEEGFSAVKCLVDGSEVVLADYITQNGIDTKLPLIGDYSGQGVNISFKSIENGIVNFYAPVFNGIQYRMAKNISNYEKEFQSRIQSLSDTGTMFSCNCILNFLYGELEGKNIEAFAGPITFGEIAYQLVNQTLVYVTVND